MKWKFRYEDNPAKLVSALAAVLLGCAHPGFALDNWVWVSSYPHVYSYSESAWFFCFSADKALRVQSFGGQDYELLGQPGLDGWVWMSSFPYIYSPSRLEWYSYSSPDDALYARNLSTENYELLGHSNPVAIHYNGTSVSVDNPLEGVGVSVQVSGADVTVTANGGLVDIDYVLSGSSPDGMFKIYSDLPFNLHLDGLTLTNVDGPAINNQADEEVTVELVAGTTTTLTDGVTYADPPAEEDQKAAFFSEGQMIFTGSGNLLVNGRGIDQHGLGSDDYIEIHSGTILIQSATKDAVHTNEGYLQQGGSVQVVTSGSDGVDAGNGPVHISGGDLIVFNPNADNDALKCKGDLVVTGGMLDLTVDGDQSKGLNAANIQLRGGAVTIATSGGVVLEASGSGYDPSYCTAIKADTLVLLDGCQVSISTTGAAGRGISSDGDIRIRSGSLSITSSGNGGTYVNESGQQDATQGTCLKANGNLELTGGTVLLKHSGKGGKGISVDGTLAIGTASSSPVLEITTTGASISTGSSGATEAKAISVDGAITIENGEITISSADDGIKSKDSIVVNAGLIDILKSVEGIEAPNITINAGEVHVLASDDGINATYGVDGEFNDGSLLLIAGGWVHVSTTKGDCIDSNGNFTMSGGTLVAHAPWSNVEVGVDVNGTFLITGGFMAIASGTSNMLESPSSQSTQLSAVLTMYQSLSAGTLFHIQDPSGNSLVTFKSERQFSAFTFSSPDLVKGTTYSVYTGGTCTGTLQDGLYIGGTYSGGTLLGSYTQN